jgi:2-ketocyclohexanecarboxyl-CoA hydrolase
VLNAIRVGMYEEITEAVLTASWNRDISVIVLTGAGTRAFCVGGDTSDKKAKRQGRGTIGVPVEQLHAALRDVPKASSPRYAGTPSAVATCWSSCATSPLPANRPVRPRVGSVDPGFGTALLTRTVGEKKGREMWYLCRRNSAKEAQSMGLINHVVPDAELDAEVERWRAELLERSPTALAIAKASFNVDSEQFLGISQLGFQAVALYYQTDEAKEAGQSFREKRKPKFR